MIFGSRFDKNSCPFCNCFENRFFIHSQGMPQESVDRKCSQWSCHSYPSFPFQNILIFHPYSLCSAPKVFAAGLLFVPSKATSHQSSPSSSLAGHFYGIICFVVGLLFLCKADLLKATWILAAVCSCQLESLWFHRLPSSLQHQPHTCKQCSSVVPSWSLLDRCHSCCLVSYWQKIQIVRCYHMWLYHSSPW